MNRFAAVATGTAVDSADADQTPALVAFGVGGACLVSALVLRQNAKNVPAEAGDVTSF